MDSEGSNFVCSVCGDVLPLSRKEAHDLYWCAALEQCEVEPQEKMKLPPSSVSDMTKGWLHGVVDVSLCSVPMALKFEQQSVFGDAGTGGGVWHSELIMAQRCVREVSSRPKSSSRPLRVLELGCGVAPAAGLVSLAMGCDVLFTDMEHLLPHVEANIRLNHSSIVQLREERGLPFSGAISRSSCDTESLLFGTPLSPRVLAMCPFDLVLCSDCVFREELHDPLGYTLQQLLIQNKAHQATSPMDNKSHLGKCVVSFLKREPFYSNFVDNTCMKYGLKVSRCADIRSLYDDVSWCTAADAAALDDNFQMYDISLANGSRDGDCVA
jgi:hypothetical protein